MFSWLWKLIFLIGFFVSIVIRRPYAKQAKVNPVREKHRTPRESWAVGLATTGSLLLPVIYIVLSPWISWGSYELPFAASLTGSILLLLGLILFWRSHADLDKNWSVSLELREEHSLITTGVYKYIRHPMYSSMFLIALAQPLLLHHWIAGPAGFLGMGAMYLLRIQQEEAMMLSQFGDEYKVYCQRTGRLWPKLWPKLTKPSSR